MSIVIDLTDEPSPPSSQTKTKTKKPGYLDEVFYLTDSSGSDVAAAPQKQPQRGGDCDSDDSDPFTNKRKKEPQTVNKKKKAQKRDDNEDALDAAATANRRKPRRSKEEIEEERVQKERAKKERKHKNNPPWWDEVALILPTSPGSVALEEKIRRRFLRGHTCSEDLKHPPPEAGKPFKCIRADDECAVPGSLYRWTWRARECCGINAVVESLNAPPPRVPGLSPPVLLERAILVVPSDRFLDLVIAEDDFTNFASLSEYLCNVRDTLQNMPGHQDVRLEVVLVGADAACTRVAAKRNNGEGRKLSKVDIKEKLKEAVCMLALDFEVEVITKDKDEDVVEHLAILHRALGKAIYAAAITNLDCAVKKKVPKGGDSTQASAAVLRQTFINMLTTLDGMSEQKAEKLVGDKRYSCPKKLFEAYLGAPGRGEFGNDILINAFDDRRQQTKLSGVVFHAITSKDPQQTLGRDT